MLHSGCGTAQGVSQFTLWHTWLQGEQASWRGCGAALRCPLLVTDQLAFVELVSRSRLGSPPGWPPAPSAPAGQLLQVVGPRFRICRRGNGFRSPKEIPISFLVEHSEEGQASGVRRELSLAWLPRGMGRRTPDTMQRA